MRHTTRAVKKLRKECQSLAKAAQDDVNGMKKAVLLRMREHAKMMEGIVGKYQREMKERKRLFNLVQELRGNIRVLCRVRPSNPDEGEKMAVQFTEENEILMTKKGRDKTWEFDKVHAPSTPGGSISEKL